MSIPSCPLCLSAHVAYDPHEGTVCLRWECSYSARGAGDVHQQLCEMAAKARAWDQLMQLFGKSPERDILFAGYLAEERKKGGIT